MEKPPFRRGLFHRFSTFFLCRTTGLGGYSGHARLVAEKPPGGRKPLRTHRPRLFGTERVRNRRGQLDGPIGRNRRRGARRERDSLVFRNQVPPIRKIRNGRRIVHVQKTARFFSRRSVLLLETRNRRGDRPYRVGSDRPDDGRIPDRPVRRFGSAVIRKVL